ncbi:MAG: GNAT family N-acetyltransferase, partial [Planctomycetales bacterium]|nr:GNAT family N-acetyltransferase [Planctomycetales bacterium]
VTAGFKCFESNKIRSFRRYSGNLGELRISELSLQCAADTLRWIHNDLPDNEFQLQLDEALSRLQQSAGPLPLEVRLDGRLLAACYFKPLPGNVATLGGVRAAPQAAPLAAQLLRQQVQRLLDRSVAQIQAVVPASDPDTLPLIQQAGFQYLTEIQHLWRKATPGDERPARHPLRSLNQAKWEWRPANSLAKSRMARLVDATFADTLDCPALNQLRCREEVLQGFLDGRDFRRLSQWQVLYHDSQPVGCLLLTAHPNAVVELAYMGLVPEARGQQLGSGMLQRAIDASRKLDAKALVVAVDENNWPALAIYRSRGFQLHQQLSVWLANSD